MKLVKLLSFLIVALVLVSVTLANNSIDESLALRRAETDTANLAKEIALLKHRVAEAGSITRLAKEAQAAGYIETGKISNIHLPSLTASR